MLQRARDRLRTGWAKLGKHRRRLLLHIAVLFALGVIFALITLAHPFASLQWTFSDQLFLPELASPNVVIAAVDDETLEQYGRLGEWPRSLHAQAIEKLSQAGARVIGFDVLFAETSDEDAVLADAMAEAGNVVQPILGTQGLPSRGAEKVFQKFLQPTPDLYPASPSLGHANVLPDPDGKVRRLPLVIEDPQGQRHPAFSLAMLHTYDNAHWDKVAQRWVCTEPFLVEDYSIHDGTLHLGDQRAIPVDASQVCA